MGNYRSRPGNKGLVERKFTELIQMEGSKLWICADIIKKLQFSTNFGWKRNNNN